MRAASSVSMNGRYPALGFAGDAASIANISGGHRNEQAGRTRASRPTPSGPRTQAANFFLLKNRRAVDRVRAPASLKDIRATAETGRPKCARAVRYRHTPNPFASFSCLPSNSEDRISKIMGRFPWRIVAAVHNTMLVTVNEHRE
jgi:hypothetical protein